MGVPLFLDLVASVSFGRKSGSRRGVIAFLAVFAAMRVQAGINIASKWVRQIGGGSNETGYPVAVDASCDVYHLGTFQNSVDFDQGPSVTNLTSVGLADAFVLKPDSNGNYLRVVLFGRTGQDSGRAVSVKLLSMQSFVTVTFYHHMQAVLVKWRRVLAQSMALSFDGTAVPRFVINRVGENNQDLSCAVLSFERAAVSAGTSLGDSLSPFQSFGNTDRMRSKARYNHACQ